jgi:hypothetical protein
MAAKKHKWDTKDPDEVYEYEHDWAPRLLFNGAAVGDSVLTMADPDPLKRPTCVAETGDVECFNIVNVPATSKIRYWVRGGTIKTEFLATIWTAQGRSFQERFVLPVKEV